MAVKETLVLLLTVTCAYSHLSILGNILGSAHDSLHNVAGAVLSVPHLNLGFEHQSGFAGHRHPVKPATEVVVIVEEEGPGQQKPGLNGFNQPGGMYGDNNHRPYYHHNKYPYQNGGQGPWQQGQNGYGFGQMQPGYGQGSQNRPGYGFGNQGQPSYGQGGQNQPGYGQGSQVKPGFGFPGQGQPDFGQGGNGFGQGQPGFGQGGYNKPGFGGQGQSGFGQDEQGQNGFGNPGQSGNNGFGSQGQTENSFGNQGQNSNGFDNQGQIGNNAFSNQGQNGNNGLGNQGQNGNNGFGNQGQSGNNGFGNQGQSGNNGFGNQGQNGNDGFGNQGQSGNGFNNNPKPNPNSDFGTQNPGQDLGEFGSLQPTKPGSNSEFKTPDHLGRTDDKPVFGSDDKFTTKKPEEDKPFFVPLNPNEYVYGGDKITVKEPPKRQTDNKNPAEGEDDEVFPIDIRFRDD